MFIGHYGVSFAAKRFAPRLPLAALFVAVQLVDVLFMAFVLTGVEKVRIVPGFTAANPWDLYFMPYSHSLVAHLGWAALAAAVTFAITRRPRAAVIFGAAVFSHWVADLLMHTPDMPLAGDDTLKVGLGAWRSLPLTIALELLALGGGVALYRQRFVIGRRLVGVLVVMTALIVVAPLMPPPSGPVEFAVQALVAYLALAGVAHWSTRGAAELPAAAPAP